MATNESQRRWRNRNRLVKHQLNVMARKLVHDYLDEIADRFALRGKGEAVTFAAFVTQSMIQQSGFNPEAARLMVLFSEVYHADRDLYSASGLPPLDAV
ncbi:MAG: hypothetical protein HQL33_00735 [Alphaproteobacteria bacterium]|nr:hypothetical protein [Alphaproteobacteria bacterium]MBF0128494.1 hypothetical protein [Alphaproteobacteria bacterium]